MMNSAERDRRFAAQEEFLGENKAVNAVQPMVSVIVTTYQHAAFIRQCLDGILMQETTFPFEIVIGEDESTDGTRDICIEYAREHQDRIRLFLRSRSLSNYVEGGVTRRLNGTWCRRSARGKYMAMCEGDDYWTSREKLQKQVDFLESHADCSMLFHNVLCVTDDSSAEPRPAYGENMGPFYELLDLLPYNFIYTASVLYRRDALPRPLPEWYYRMPMGDWPTCLLLARAGRVAYLPQIMSAYRIHAGGVWSQLSRGQRVEKTILASEILLRELLCDLPERNEAAARLYRGLRDMCIELGDDRRAAGYARKLVVYASKRCVRETRRVSREFLIEARMLLITTMRSTGAWLRQALRRTKMRLRPSGRRPSP